MLCSVVIVIQNGFELCSIGRTLQKLVEHKLMEVATMSMQRLVAISGIILTVRVNHSM